MNQEILSSLNENYKINFYKNKIFLKNKNNGQKKIIDKTDWTNLITTIADYEYTSSKFRLLIEILNRRDSYKKINHLETFYHIAAMNNWKDVVLEQKEIVHRLQLDPKCVVLGEPADAKWVKDQGLNVIHNVSNLKEYELPTLEKVYEYCKKNKNNAVLYFHTKGVSCAENDPLYESKKMWRWIMMEYVLAKWKKNLEELSAYDSLGIDWQDEATLPHFAGNFWMARADWIYQLRNPRDYKERPHHPPRNEPDYGNPWERMAAESWLGSEQWHMIKSIGIRSGGIAGSGCPLYEPYRHEKEFFRSKISSKEAIEYILNSSRS
jgi:hypothetical protein